MANKPTVKPLAQLVQLAISMPDTNREVPPADQYDESNKEKGTFTWAKRMNKVTSDLSKHCTEKQIAIIEDMGVCALEFQDVEQAFRAQIRAHIAELHGNTLPSYAQYNAIVAALRVGMGEYTAESYRLAIRHMPASGYLPAEGPSKKHPLGLRAVLGSVPVKGDSRNKGGQKGNDPTRWSKGMHRDVESIINRMQNVPKADIDPAAMQLVRDAVKAIIAADKALIRAVMKQKVA